MFRVGRVLVMLLQMDERAGCLDQPLEILRVFRRYLLTQPHLFQNVVRLVITLLVPASEKGAVIRMGCDPVTAHARFVRAQRFYEPRNPLAFAHEGLNLTAPAMMGKRRPFAGGKWHGLPACDCPQPGWLCHDPS